MARRVASLAVGPSPPRTSAGARRLGAAVLAGGAAALIAGLLIKPKKPRQPKRGFGAERRQLNAAASILALAVLLDSAVEHYRGSFENPGMYAPLLVSAGVAASSLPLAVKPRPAAGSRRLLLASAAAIGAGGTGFHIYNIVKRPGGLSWLNLFYAAPFGAPAALMLSGVIGWAADELQSARGEPVLLGMPAGPALAAVTVFGLAGTVAEVWLLHYRGAFQDPFMYVPVSVPPAAALLLAGAAWTGQEGLRSAARAALLASAAVGIAGIGFHSYGISRAMGGWRNWSQNLLDGPPLPAPPAFTALSLAGLAALSLLERDRK